MAGGVCCLSPEGLPTGSRLLHSWKERDFNWISSRNVDYSTSSLAHCSNYFRCKGWMMVAAGSGGLSAGISFSELPPQATYVHCALIFSSSPPCFRGIVHKQMRTFGSKDFHFQVILNNKRYCRYKRKWREKFSENGLHKTNIFSLLFFFFLRWTHTRNKFTSFTQKGCRKYGER